MFTVIPAVGRGRYQCSGDGTWLANMSRHMLMPPPGYSIAGVSGSCGRWIDGFQLIITR